MKPTPIYQVDAFSARPFAGNPAAVCLMNFPRDASWMQSVAVEMNLVLVSCSPSASTRCAEPFLVAVETFVLDPVVTVSFRSSLVVVLVVI